ncbi:hypothetical protein FGB62_5g034 [Gracilaria domingensis]|nr:hypothetical protein FGB62_5g034 [Gracilaria domingensis]
MRMGRWFGRKPHRCGHPGRRQASEVVRRRCRCRRRRRRGRRRGRAAAAAARKARGVERERELAAVAAVDDRGDVQREREEGDGRRRQARAGQGAATTRLQSVRQGVWAGGHAAAARGDGARRHGGAVRRRAVRADVPFHRGGAAPRARRARHARRLQVRRVQRVVSLAGRAHIAPQERARAAAGPLAVLAVGPRVTRARQSRNGNCDAPASRNGHLLPRAPSPHHRHITHVPSSLLRAPPIIAT